MFQLNALASISILLISAVVFTGVGYFIRKSIAEAKISSAEEAAEQIRENALKEADALKKETVLKRKMKFIRFAQKLRKKYAIDVMRFSVKKDV